MAEGESSAVFLAQLCGLLSVMRARCPVDSAVYHLYACLYFNAWYALTDAQPGSWQYLVVWGMVACAHWCDRRLCKLIDAGSEYAYATCVVGSNLHFVVFLLTRSHVERAYVACACVAPFVHVLAVMRHSSLERQMWALVESCLVQQLFYALRHPSSPPQHP